MCTAMVPADMGEAFVLLESLMGFLADADPADLPVAVMAESLRALERVDAVEAVARARLLAVFSAQDGAVCDGQRSTRAWLVNTTRVTRGQAGEYQATEALAGDHQVLLAGLREGWVVTKSVALQLAKWTRPIPAEYRDEAEGILITAARAGADLRSLAAICAEIRARTAQPDPDPGTDHLDRGVSLDTTLDGAGVVRGDLTPECVAMVQAALDALSAPSGGGDLRTRPQRYHDALGEAMRRLLASDLLPKRAGQPVKALVHLYFAELRELDEDSALQDKWIGEYRARWAGHRAAASVSTGDGGAWLEGDAAREVVCDAMIIPVVTGDIDPGAVEELIALCVTFHQLRTQGTTTPDPASTAAPDPAGAPAAGTAIPGIGPVPAGLAGPAARHADQAAAVEETLAELEHQILGKILAVLSGPGGAASFLRRNLAGQGLNGPSLPLDVGQTDEIPLPR